ncbi:MAG: thioredoxin family protein [Pseudomonadota bacterium]|nr:MAG: thioredoxin family protein [Pseudomonadota bacterium]
MARTPSTMVPLGTPMPEFSLPDVVSGRTVTSQELAGRPSVVIFICNHCPFVKHIRTELARFGEFCQDRGVGMVAISSNDVTTYPEDGPEQMAREAREAGYVFPYLFDESQAVARAFRAACTPDLYIFDSEGKLAYHGQFDDSRPGNDVPVTGQDARAAVAALLLGGRPSAEQKPSIGCNIKWKPGNEPE